MEILSYYYSKMISRRLNEALNMRNLKQSDLVTLTGLGKSAISQYLSGKVTPKGDKLLILAKALNVSVSWLMGEKNAIEPTQNIDTSKKKGIKIPVLGKVVAGIPIEAVTDIISYEEISEELSRTGEFFALQVKGDSMAPRIRENDVVIVKKQSTVENKEVAIVVVNGNEATIKEIQIQKDGITLIGWNPAVYTPHFYSIKDIETLPIKIIGKVIELRGKF